MDAGGRSADLAGLVSSVRALAPADDDDDERIDQIRLLEELKAAAAAAQARVTAAFVASRRTAAAVAGVPTDRQDQGVAAQVGLARRVSPWQARRYVGWCAILTSELPATFTELQAGRISEWRAMLVARETIFLSREDRAAADLELAPQLEGWSDRRVEAETKKVAYRLDPHGYLARTRGATKDRRVSIRPAPDTMCRLTAFLPVAQGVAAYAALTSHADTTVAAGDERGRGQIMADTFVERLTGQTTAEAVPVEIELVMTDATLLGDEDDPQSDEPAELVGFGPIPAGLARDLALAETQARRSIRRLFRKPRTGELAAMDTTARTFTANMARFIRVRDAGICRTPWCGAPIRHTDHIEPWANGGKTTVGNGDGLCEGCNHAKQAAGWQQRVHPDGTIETRTPTGHRYRSPVPDPPGTPAVHYRVQTRIIDLVYHRHAA